MLTRLRAMGVQLSIDDFGTGYSSLSYLQRLPMNMVKIDQSFIQEILTQASPAPIVRAIIAMAHSLDLLVLAEGVEREAQRMLLLELGCDQAQGYLFGRPIPEDEFAALLPFGQGRLMLTQAATESQGSTRGGAGGSQVQ